MLAVQQVGNMFSGFEQDLPVSPIVCIRKISPTGVGIVQQGIRVNAIKRLNVCGRVPKPSKPCFIVVTDARISRNRCS